MATAIAASTTALLSTHAKQQPEQKTFKRIRSSLESTLRTATRSRGREPAHEDHEDTRSSSVIKKLEKVTFRRSKDPNEDKPITPFTAPSLRMAAMSSPAIHQLPPKSPLASPSSSRPQLDPGPRERRSSAQATQLTISPPAPLTPKRGHRSTASVPITPTLVPRTSVSRRVTASPSPPPTPSTQKPLRRSSVDRHNSPSPPPSPTPKVRLRERSPSQRVYSANRLYNTSNLSLAANPNPSVTSLSNIGASSSSPPPLSPLSAERESVRTASSMLIKELRTAVKHKDWEEVEQRIQALTRAERVWGKSSSNTPLSSTLAGEERERKLFISALKDGYVLCFLINKLSPRPVVLPSPSPSSCISNVHRFLAACSSYGLAQEDLFQPEDLLSSDDADAAAKVAQTIVALLQYVPSRIYTTGRAASSTPNLGLSQSPKSRAPPSPTRERIPPDRPLPPTPTRERNKRWNPSAGLPTVRSDSPNELDRAPSSRQSGSKTRGGNDGDLETTAETINEQPSSRHRGPSSLKPALRTDVLTPPPRSPLRTHSPGSSSPSPIPGSSPPLPRRSSSGFSSPVPIPRTQSNRDSVATTATRQSAMSDTTTYSSLLEVPRVRASSNVTKFGTIRTMTTDVTSIDDGEEHNQDEVEEAVFEQQEKKRTPPREKPKLFLGKGRWPDDFILTPPREDDHAFGKDFDDDDLFVSSPVSASPAPNPSVISLAATNSSISVSRSSTPTSGSPRKLAIVGVPRRPIHRSRHSIDAPILKPALRDASPDSIAPPPKVMLRRHSTKPNYHLAPRNKADEVPVPVPFPRTSSSELRTDSPLSSSPPERPRIYRGRFQSEIDGAGSRRRPRPNSYDDLGGGDRRSRIESMGHIGAASPTTERASDLLRSDSVDVTRQTLVIKEPGKPPTHFQLGNCIGRGQFGSVYRALNLNTGQMVAVKRLRLEGLKEEEVTQLMKEVDLVKSLSHPSIVKYEGMARDHDTLSIVLEFCENGSLGQTLKAFGKLNERLVASYVVKILEGLDYLHSSGVVHCDLKAANILTTKNGNVKLSDFGVSLNMRAMEKESGVNGTGVRGKNHAKNGASEVAGTPNWMAPEVIELKGASPKSDIWSLGCTVVELLTGRPPYADVGNSMSVMFRIVEDDQPPIPDDCSSLLKEFLLQCFQKDPAKRPSAVDLCEHQWLKKNWSGHKELRPQDSIPFLRRVSADLQKSEAVRYLSQIEMPEDTKPESSGSPPKIRHVRSSQQSLADRDAISPREHAFVKTTFSKPMVCRVCLLHAKKSAVLCAQCSLIAHAKCSSNAPPTCDLRAQLLLYAQYAEKGNPHSVYSNPVDLISDALPKSPMSDVSYVAGSPRTSIDQPRPHQNRPVPIPSKSAPTNGVPQVPTAGSPPTAFKFMNHFKRSRSNLNADAQQTASAPDLNKREDAPTRSKSRRERPESLSSDSTNRNSSIRSSATGKKSVYSANSNLADVAEGEPSTTERTETDSRLVEQSQHSTMTIPGELPEDGQHTRRPHHKRHVQSKSSGNCTVQ